MSRCFENVVIYLLNKTRECPNSSKMIHLQPMTTHFQNLHTWFNLKQFSYFLHLKMPLFPRQSLVYTVPKGKFCIVLDFVKWYVVCILCKSVSFFSDQVFVPILSSSFINLFWDKPFLLMVILCKKILKILVL